MPLTHASWFVLAFGIALAVSPHTRAHARPYGLFTRDSGLGDRVSPCVRLWLKRCGSRYPGAAESEWGACGASRALPVSS